MFERYKKRIFSNNFIERRKKIRRFFKKNLSIIVILIFLSTGFCFAVEPIRVGVVYPLTGPIAEAGSYQKG